MNELPAWGMVGRVISDHVTARPDMHRRYMTDPEFYHSVCVVRQVLQGVSASMSLAGIPYDVAKAVIATSVDRLIKNGD